MIDTPRRLSKYAAKKARQAEEARLAELRPEPEPEVVEEPEPRPMSRRRQLVALTPKPGQIHLPKGLNEAQARVYYTLVDEWRAAEPGRKGKRPGTKAKYEMRRRAVAEAT